MKFAAIAVLVLSIASFSFAAEDVVTATHGTVTKIDKTAKTIAIRSEDGTEHVFHWTKDTTVHGVKATDAAADAAAKDSWHGLKEGSEVIAHSSERGGQDTALEVDKIGDNGLHKTEGTVKEFDRSSKKLVVETADGTDHTFQLTSHAAADAGKDIAADTAKGTKVVVYSTESSSKKVAHFFEKM